MDSEADLFAALRNDFNFAYVSEFMHNFASAFFNAREDDKPTSPFLEHLLLYQDDPKKIGNFYLKLLKALPGWRTTNYDTWFEGLAKEYKKRELDVDFPSPSPPVTILTIPVKQRLQMLRNLCDFHLEQCDHFWQLVRDGDAEDALRQESIGVDAQGRRYWIFSDGRLYRDRTPIKNATKNPEEIEDESNWELVCLTRSDYEEFLQNGLSAKPKDRALVKLINQEWMPELEKTLNYQLAQHRKYFRPVNTRQEVLLPRKRSSRLVEKKIIELQRKEIEEAARKEQERQQREARAALIGRDLNLPPTLPEESVDLALQRELRARERELKKEKEAQVRAIEEAFFASQAVVDVEDVEETTPEPIQHSPIKLVLKLNNNSVGATELPAQLHGIFTETKIDIEAVDVDAVESVQGEIVSDDNDVDILSEKEATIESLGDAVVADNTESPVAADEDIAPIPKVESSEATSLIDAEPVPATLSSDAQSKPAPVDQESRDVAEFLSSQFSQ